MTVDNPIIALEAQPPLILPARRGGSLSKDALTLSEQRLSAKQPKTLPLDQCHKGLAE